ncbi:hypothetical protein F6455_05365 [Proteobacteria bacterium 005FR1]|nr:hypothetical protein [Proteobacteria bacterium 005FR1]
MALLSLLVFLFTCACIIWVEVKLAGSLWRSPAATLAAVGLLSIPYIFALSLDHRILPSRVLALGFDVDVAIVKHNLAYSVYFLAVFFGALFFRSLYVCDHAGSNAPRLSNSFWDDAYIVRKAPLIGCCLLAVFAFIELQKLNGVGGFDYLIKNLDSRTTITAGTGYLTAVAFIVSILSISFFTIYHGHRRSFVSIALLVFSVAAIVGVNVIYGGRKGPLVIVIFSLVLYSAHVKRFRIATLRNAIGFALVLLYSAVMPLFRVAGAVEYYLARPAELLPDAMSNIGVLFRRLTDIDTSLFIFEAFDSTNYWLGKHLLGIFYAPLPRSYFPAKPPVDDGVYIYNMAVSGSNVDPLTPMTNLLPAGWPLTNVTSAFVTGGFMLVPLFGILMGIVAQYVYRKMARSGRSPETLFIYLMVVVGNFQFTTLRLANFFTWIVLIVVLMGSLRILTSRARR